MLGRMIVAGSVLGLLAWAPPASARGEAPKPPPELDAAMKYFTGTWRCDGRMPAGAMGPGSPETPYQVTVKLRRERALADFWYTGEYETRGKGVPPWRAIVHVGFDPVAGKLVGFGLDNQGGWRATSSPGWQGDRLVIAFEGTIMGKKMQGRETITRKSDREFTRLMEMGSTNMQRTGEETCKR